MKRKMMIVWAATAALSCSAWSMADDVNKSVTHEQANQPHPQQVGDQSTPPGTAKDLWTRGNMSERDFDGHFVQHAAEANLTEIQIGKVVEQKSQDPEIKQFAQKIVQDHEQANAQLKQIAQSKNFNWPAQLDEVGQSKVGMFEKLSGPNIDRAFVFGMVGDHATAVLWYRAGARLLTDPQLKQYAEQTLPTLHHHLREARNLAGGEEAETAGARLHGDKSADRPSDTPSNSSK